MSLFLRSTARACALCAVVLTPLPALAQTPLVTRGPYLQRGSSQAIVVRWRTDQPTDSRVTYGSQPGNLTSTVQDLLPLTEHEIELSGLTPDTTYYYAIGSSTQILAGDDADHFFVTAPPTGTAKPTRIWILGDSGTGDQNVRDVRDAYLAFTGATHTDLWLMLGDNAYPDGTDAEYQATLFDIFPTMLRKSVLFPTLGNHDAINADSPTQSGVYYDIFTLPANGEAGGLPSGTEAYYAFDYGNIHFVVLDSMETYRFIGGPMMTWLEMDLAATTQDWVIAFWHVPPYSKGSHDSDSENELVEMRDNAVRVLDAHGADLTFTGHSHSYERSYLIDGHYGASNTFVEGFKIDGGDGREDGDGVYHKANPGLDPHTGMVHTVAGNAGQTTGGMLDHPAMFISLNELGSVVLDVDGLRADVRLLDNTGTVRDYWTMIKGPIPAPPVAAFWGAPISGTAPLTVQFQDEAQNLPTNWAWDFEDDGQTDSMLTDPSHVYTQPGVYSVRETVTNALGSDAMLRPAYVCATTGIPASVGALLFDADRQTFSWAGAPDATQFDVLRGDLELLRDNGGDPSAAGVTCLSEDVGAPQAMDTGTPLSGQGFFYLVRAINCAGQQGGYDSGAASQVVSRDAALLGFVPDCGCDLAQDADADAICDALDACPLDPLNDVDGDGVCGDVDNCAAVFNPPQNDLDLDGQGDVCDACPNDALNDVDVDGICGDVDNCPLTSNAAQLDTDADGQGDACDPCPLDALDDADGDGFCADVDNCPTVNNAAQLDADIDGIGDLCDACPADPLNDIDADALCADVDNCDSTFNVVQADSDGDGVGNLCDVCPDIANTNQRDSDGDGQGNVCDCQPGDGSIRSPAAIPLTAVRSGPTAIALSWPSMLGADDYALTRGDALGLAQADFGPCLVNHLAATAYVDAAVPPVGGLYVYLVQGRSTACGLGALGHDSDEIARVNTNPSACTN